MDSLKYKKYVVNSLGWEEVYLDVSDWIKEYLSPKSVSCKDRFENINHPLVVSGDAYWFDNKTLCLGYRLISNNNLTLPVFNNSKQVIINNFQKNIKIRGKDKI